jgi:hypothetical protein
MGGFVRTDLPSHDRWHTLYRYGDTSAEMDLVVYAGPRPQLTDTWQIVGTEDGRTIAVRKADCGAGCKCAGEYRYVGGES